MHSICAAMIWNFVSLFRWLQYNHVDERSSVIRFVLYFLHVTISVALLLLVIPFCTDFILPVFCWRHFSNRILIVWIHFLIVMIYLTLSILFKYIKWPSRGMNMYSIEWLIYVKQMEAFEYFNIVSVFVRPFYQNSALDFNV